MDEGCDGGVEGFEAVDDVAGRDGRKRGELIRAALGLDAEAVPMVGGRGVRGIFGARVVDDVGFTECCPEFLLFREARARAGKAAEIGVEVKRP